MEIVPVKSIIWSNIWSMPILTQLCNNCAKYWLKLICCVNIWKWVKTNFSHHAHATESCWTVDSEVCTDPSIDHFMAFAHLLGYDDVKIIRNVTFFLRILITFAIACNCSFKLKKKCTHRMKSADILVQRLYCILSECTFTALQVSVWIRTLQCRKWSNTKNCSPLCWIGKMAEHMCECLRSLEPHCVFLHACFSFWTWEMAIWCDNRPIYGITWHSICFLFMNFLKI